MRRRRRFRIQYAAQQSVLTGQHSTPLQGASAVEWNFLHVTPDLETYFVQDFDFGITY